MIRIFLKMSQGEEGLLVIVILLVLFGFGFIYVAIDNAEKKHLIKKNIESGKVNWDDYFLANEINDKVLARRIDRILSEKEKQTKLDDLKKLEKNKDILESDIRLDKKFKVIEEQIHNCNKCSNNRYRIWKLSNTILILRCDDCKKRFEYYNDEIKNVEFKNVIKDIEFLKERDIFEQANDLIKKSVIEYDNVGKRSNLPSTYHFVLYSTLEPIKFGRNKILQESKRSRRISQDVKDAVWRRDEGKCIECGSNENLEFDHIIPHSKGGANTYRNIQLLCEKCNRQKSANIG